MSHILAGRCAVITGASQGLGLEIARQYVAAGANVALCARSEKSLLESRQALLQTVSGDQRVFSLAVDVSDEKSVVHFVAEVIRNLGRIDILINNAGVYGPKGEIDTIDWAEWVHAVEINLLGSILMCRAVLPVFKAQRRGKIVQLSGGGATSPMPCVSAYAVSKAAVVRFVETLAEEIRGFNIDVNAIAPGALNTRMLDEIIQAGPVKVGRAFYDKSVKQRETGGSPLSVGASLAVFLGSEASNGITGKLISAVWDKWEDWPAHLEELNGSDVYTLRRIVGRDRGMSWGDK